MKITKIIKGTKIWAHIHNKNLGLKEYYNLDTQTIKYWPKMILGLWIISNSPMNSVRFTDVDWAGSLLTRRSLLVSLH